MLRFRTAFDTTHTGFTNKSTKSAARAISSNANSGSSRNGSRSTPAMRELGTESTGASISRENVVVQKVPDAASKTSYRVSFFDAMKVSGPAPERINGRLAMLMFIPTALREMDTAETVVEQFQHPNIGYILLCGLVIWASMIPILKGAKDEDFWVMKVRAEKIHGRLAMLGFAGLLALEYYAGGVCFF